jgi:tetratricopeptide (TPR) repeat protein
MEIVGLNQKTENRGRVIFAFMMFLGGGVLPGCTTPDPMSFNGWSEEQSSETDPFVAAQDSVVESVQAAIAYGEMDRSEAVLGQAITHLDQEPELALELCRRVLEIPQPDTVMNRANWIVGESLLRIGEPIDALEAWSVIENTPVDEYLELRRIQVLLTLNRNHDAVARADQLVEQLRDTNSELIHEVRESGLNGTYSASDWPEFLRRAEAFLDRYPDYPRHDAMLFKMGSASFHMGLYEEGVSYWDQAAWRYPFRPSGLIAGLMLDWLEDRSISIPEHRIRERIERADTLVGDRHWDLAHRELSQLLSELDDTESRTAHKVRHLRARNSYASAHYQRAYDDIITVDYTRVSGLSRYSYLTLLSDVFARLGRFDEARERVELRDRGRSSDYRASSLGEFYEENGLFGSALEDYQIARSDREEREFEHTLLLMAAGHYEEAYSNLEQLVLNGGTNRKMYGYWRARMIWELGDEAGAVAAFREVVQDYPRTYYGLQAVNRIWEITGEWPGAQQEIARDYWSSMTPEEREQRPAILHWNGPFDENDSYESFVASGHRVTGVYTEPVDSSALRSVVEQYGDLFPSIGKAQFLMSVGLSEEAFWESREALREFRSLNAYYNHRAPTTSRPIQLDTLRYAHYIDHRSDPVGYWGHEISTLRWPMAEGEQRAESIVRQRQIYDSRYDIHIGIGEALPVLGDYHGVRRFIGDEPDWNLTGITDENLLEWSQYYPRAFSDQVVARATRHGVNPYIVWAIMTVESAYNPDSVSRADARGLLQVIPKTGELIAHRLGHWDFGPANLMNPSTSIDFGCYYLSELFEKFQGQEFFAYAGYNGGPFNVGYWLEGRGALDLDLFVEMIPFRETRRYVKKIYRYTSLYRELYLGESHLYVGQQINPVFGDNIHY